MTQESYKTYSTAPGKIVLWGEYAVLEGAPAVTMAVSRYSKVDLATTQESWEFTSKHSHAKPTWQVSDTILCAGERTQKAQRGVFFRGPSLYLY